MGRSQEYQSVMAAASRRNNTIIHQRKVTTGALAMSCHAIRQIAHEFSRSYLKERPVGITHLSGESKVALRDTARYTSL